MKNLLSLLAVLFIFSACNNRENALLPPGLSAADYLSGNTIESYANYLVKSANDDSYLLIDKSAIADSLLNYGDVIVFRKVPGFASRDSLAVQSGAIPLGDTYEYGILRSGEAIYLSSDIPLATVYTNCKPTRAESFLLSYSYYLQASPVQPISYGSDRGYFPLYTTGEFALFDLNLSDNPQIQIAGSAAVHAMLLDSAGNQLGINFPAAYCAASGTIDLSMGQSLNQTEQSSLQNFFPNAAISTPVLSMQTSSSPGGEIAVLRLTGNSKGYFGKQWTRLSQSVAYTWPEENPTSGTANWWQEGSTLYSFISSSGKYFLLSPLQSQNEFSIALDGSLSQVLLQDLWFDLNGLSLPNTSLKVKLNPDSSSLLSAYFNANPFTIQGANNAFELSFWQGDTLLRNLPDEAWIEFGFRTDLSVTANDRLFEVYRDALEDDLSYKTSASSYDASHYSRSGSYVYSGIASSATYLYGSISDTSLQNIPYRKPKLSLQSSRSLVSWDEGSKRSFSRLSLNHTVSSPSHPWLSGEPLSVTNSQALASFSFYQGDSVVSAIPANFFLSLPVVSSPENLILFDNSSYPRLKHYLPSSTHTGESFVVSDNRLVIYPEFPGLLLAAQLSYSNPLQLRVYPTMTFVLSELRLYTYGNAPDGQSALFGISRSAALSDPYQIISSQYSLSQTSSAYQISTSDEENFTVFEPMLFFKRSTRGQNLLIYEQTGEFYRLYPYSQSTEFDPWAFLIDGAYNGIALANSGSYASFADTNAHTAVSSVINTATRDAVLSLYQAQFVLPSYYLGTTIPMASTMYLDKISAMPGIPNLLSSYQLRINNPVGTPLIPDFYNVVGSSQVPYIYIPLANTSAISSARMFYRNLAGQTTELSRVNSFGLNYASEYVVVGNSFICTVPNPGIFYLTGP